MSYLLLMGVLVGSGCCTRDPIVAHVGKTHIRASEFEQQMAFSPAQYEGYLATQLGRKKYLDVLINEELIVQAAYAQGLHKDPEFIQAYKDKKAEYEFILKDFFQKTLIKAFIERHKQTDLSISDAELEEYYNRNKKEFEYQHEIIVRHILFDSEADARKALERLHKGEVFETLVSELSLDTVTRKHKGELLPFTESTIIPEFKDTVLGLKVQECSGVIKSEYGYHIIKKIKETLIGPQSEKVIKEQMRKILEKEKFVNLIEAYKKKFGVRIKEQNL